MIRRTSVCCLPVFLSLALLSCTETPAPQAPTDLTQVLTEILAHWGSPGASASE